MFPVTTVDTQEDLTLAGESVHAPTSRARLRRVGGVNFRQLTPLPGELVGEELGQEAPTLIEDSTCESSVGLHHVADLQILNHDRAVALGVVVAELVTEVLTLSPDLAVQVGNTGLRFLSVLRSFLPSRDRLLSTRKPLESLAVEAWGLEEQAVRVRDYIRDTSVDGYDRFSLRLRGFDFNQADNRDEPLIPVPLEGAGLRLAFEGSVNDGSDVAELGEADDIAIQSPGFGMRFTQPERVNPLPLPPRTLSELLEASLPRLVQLNEKLGANVTRNISEPGEIPTKLCQFVDLVEGGGVDPLPFGSGESRPPLLIREVPQEPQGRFPMTEPRDLRGRRVDAIAESLACDHERHCAIGLSCRQGTFAQENVKLFSW